MTTARRRTIPTLPQDAATDAVRPRRQHRSTEPASIQAHPLLIHVADRRRRVGTAMLAHPLAGRTERRG